MSEMNAAVSCAQACSVFAGLIECLVNLLHFAEEEHHV